MASRLPPAASRPARRGASLGLWAGLDIVLVVLFAVLGRRSHAEGLSLTGTLTTAAPFLAGLATGWVALVARSMSPVAWRSGVLLVVTTVTVGMLLRVAVGDGTTPSFVLVATAVLGALLIGWRVAWARLRD